MSWWRWVVVIGLLGWYVVGTWRQVGVWRSEEALWARAVAVSPWKPRVWANLGGALVLAGKLAEGQAAWRQAERLTELGWVSEADRRITRETIARNREAVRARLTGRPLNLRVVRSVAW